MNTPADHTHLTEQERERLEAAVCTPANEADWTSVLADTVERILADRLSARPAPGPDAATALDLRALAESCAKMSHSRDSWNRLGWGGQAQAIDQVQRLLADRLAAASPAPDPATEDTETLARVRELALEWETTPVPTVNDDYSVAECSAEESARTMNALGRRLRAALEPAPRDGCGDHDNGEGA